MIAMCIEIMHMYNLGITIFLLSFWTFFNVNEVNEGYRTRF